MLTEKQDLINLNRSVEAKVGKLEEEIDQIKRNGYVVSDLKNKEQRLKLQEDGNQRDTSFLLMKIKELH